MSGRRGNLKVKLAQQLPGILNLVLAALGHLLTTERFEMPESAIKAVQNWRHEVNPVSHFIEVCCTKSPAAQTDFTRLQMAFSRFVRAETEGDPWPANAFSRRLTRLGYGRVKASGGRRVVLGLALNEGGAP